MNQSQEKFIVTIADDPIFIKEHKTYLENSLNATINYCETDKQLEKLVRTNPLSDLYLLSQLAFSNISQRRCSFEANIFDAYLNKPRLAAKLIRQTAQNQGKNPMILTLDQNIDGAANPFLDGTYGEFEGGIKRYHYESEKQSFYENLTNFLNDNDIRILCQRKDRQSKELALIKKKYPFFTIF